MIPAGLSDSSVAQRASPSEPDRAGGWHLRDGVDRPCNNVHLTDTADPGATC